MSGEVAITAFNMITAYGHGVDISWKSLLDNRSTIGAPKRVSQARFDVAPVAESSGFDSRLAPSNFCEKSTRRIERLLCGTLEELYGD